MTFLACVVDGSLGFFSFVCRVLSLVLSELLLELLELLVPLELLELLEVLDLPDLLELSDVLELLARSAA